MPIRKLVIAAIISACMAPAFSSPVEFDTESAHVIVVRPIDAWSGDKKVSEQSLELLQKKEVGYFVKQDGTIYRGSPLTFQGISDHPITKTAETLLLQKGVRPAKSANFFTIQAPIEVSPGGMNTLAQAQEMLYRAMVFNQGNPATLEARVVSKKVIGAILAASVVALSVDKLGASGGVAFADGANLPDGIYRAIHQYKGVAAPINLPAIDFSNYQTVEVRNATFSDSTDRVGQVIIAYKVQKTPEAQAEAMARAIVSLVGADTSGQEVQQSRAADFARRSKIWSDCVAAGKCSNE